MKVDLELVRKVLDKHHPIGDPCECCGSQACSCSFVKSRESTEWDTQHVIEQIKEASE